MFHRRRNSDRANNAPAVTLAPGRQSPNDNAHHDDDHHHHQHPSSSPLPPAIPSNMRGMRRLEMRRGMEESHYLAQQKKTRTSTLNPPIDLRLVDYVSDYDSNLMCPICRCPFIDPVVLYDCHHCFCRECLQQTWTDYHPGGPRGNCPTCRANTRLKGKDGVSKIIVNMCDELLVNCPKQDEGCTARIKRGELVDHLNLYCQYSLVQCPRFPECEQPIRRKDRANCTHWGVACIDCQQVMFVDNLEQHWRRECPDRKIDCSLCDETIYYRTLDQHTKTTCPSITAPCPGGLYGCSFRSKRGELDTHARSCIFAKLAPVLDAQTTKIKELEEAKDLSTRKFAVLEGEFENLKTFVWGHRIPDLEAADPSRIPLADGEEQQRTTEPILHEPSHARELSVASVIPEIDFPAPPSARASRVMQNRLSFVTALSRSSSNATARSPTSIPTSSRASPRSEESQYHNLEVFLTPSTDAYPQFDQPATPSSPTIFTSPIHQHLLSLHENLREEVSRVARAVHDLDGRHSTLILNENMRLKEEMAYLNAQFSSVARQVGWLTSARLQAQQHVGPTPTSTAAQRLNAAMTGQAGDTDGESSGGEGAKQASQGRSMQNAVTALRGAARVVNLGTGATGIRRAGSDEGRVKL